LAKFGEKKFKAKHAVFLEDHIWIKREREGPRITWKKKVGSVLRGE